VKVIRLHNQTVTVKALFDAIELFRQNKIRNLAMIYDFEDRGEPLAWLCVCRGGSVDGDYWSN